MDEHSLHDLSFILEQLERYSSCSYVPFSHQEESVILVLSNGDWVPGIRIESASYSLTIPSLVNAYTTAIACNRDDLAFVCSSRPLRSDELMYLSTLGYGAPANVQNGIYVFDNPAPRTLAEHPLDPFLPEPPVANPEDGIQLVRSLIPFAHTPESDFPVACLLETTEGKLIPGVNVEHTNWANILCAERNALGTARTYGESAIKNIYLTCSKDPQCSPCGACRQLLAELTPEAVLWMDRGLNIRESTTPSSLLPEWFTGSTLKKNTTDC